MSTQTAIEEERKKLFGGTLAPQGRGFYVTLELLAICRGVIERANREGITGRALTALPDDGEDLIYDKQSHDLARRLLHECLPGSTRPVPDEKRAEVVAGDDAERTLEWIANVFAGLTVPRPFTRSIPDWGGLHLYPYVGELIHHDAVYRKNSPPECVNLERYLYRGAGALAYELLRADPDAERRAALDAGFTSLVADSRSPLGRLAAAVGAHDAVGSRNLSATTGRDFKDDTVRPHRPDRETHWSDLLRNGCRRILESDSPMSNRVERLMYWVPFAIARHQLDLAARSLGELPTDSKTMTMLVELDGGQQLRRLSRAEFASHRRIIEQAVGEQAKPSLAAAEASQLGKGASEASSFYASTLAVTGALNSNSGLRHYTIKTPLLEAIVYAVLGDSGEASFTEFCRSILAEDLGLIVDARSLPSAANAAWIDNATLEANAQALGDRLMALGLMTNLSDATRIVEARP